MIGTPYYSLTHVVVPCENAQEHIDQGNDLFIKTVIIPYYSIYVVPLEHLLLLVHSMERKVNVLFSAPWN